MDLSSRESIERDLTISMLNNLGRFTDMESLNAGIKMHKPVIWIRVTSGRFKDSIGTLTSVSPPTKRWCRHGEEMKDNNFKSVRLKTKPSISVTINHVEIVPNYTGVALYANDVANIDAKVYCDILGRQIKLGHFLAYAGSGAMKIGTVSKIDPHGTIYLKLVRDGTNGGNSWRGKKEEVRLGLPEQSIIMDSDMFDEILLAKLGKI